MKSIKILVVISLIILFSIFLIFLSNNLFHLGGSFILTNVQENATQYRLSLLERYDEDHNGRIVPKDAIRAMLDYLSGKISLLDVGTVFQCLSVYQGYVYEMYPDNTAVNRFTTLGHPEYLELIVNGKVVTRWEFDKYVNYSGNYIVRMKRVFGEENPAVSEDDDVRLRVKYVFDDGSPVPGYALEGWANRFLDTVKHADVFIVMDSDNDGVIEIEIPRVFHNWTFLEEHAPKSTSGGFILSWDPKHWQKRETKLNVCGKVTDWLSVQSVHAAQTAVDINHRWAYFRQYRLIPPYISFSISIRPFALCKHESGEQDNFSSSQGPVQEELVQEGCNISCNMDGWYPTNDTIVLNDTNCTIIKKKEEYRDYSVDAPNCTCVYHVKSVRWVEFDRQCKENIEEEPTQEQSCNITCPSEGWYPTNKTLVTSENNCTITKEKEEYRVYFVDTINCTCKYYVESVRWREVGRKCKNVEEPICPSSSSELKVGEVRVISVFNTSLKIYIASIYERIDTERIKWAQSGLVTSFAVLTPSITYSYTVPVNGSVQFGDVVIRVAGIFPEKGSEIRYYDDNAPRCSVTNGTGDVCRIEYKYGKVLFEFSPVSC